MIETTTKVIGVDKIYATMVKLKGRFNKKILTPAIKKAAMSCMSAVKKATPSKTGTLKRAIKIRGYTTKNGVVSAMIYVGKTKRIKVSKSGKIIKATKPSVYGRILEFSKISFFVRTIQNAYNKFSKNTLISEFNKNIERCLK